jgi:glycosyltransferase involved in cell wall biosynthesis
MIGNSIPLISCVCVTKNRLDLLKKSICCFINQTYSYKNLFILSQSNDECNKEIEDYLKEFNRNDIFLFTAPETLSLGAMRNTVVELATGPIICQWDDDDLYSPDRISTQFHLLRCNSSSVATLYCDFLKYFQNTGEIYWCDWSQEREYSHRFLCGSIMFYKSIFYEFEMFYPENGHQSSYEEDLNVLEKIISKGKITPLFAGHQYVYVHHGSNLYNLDHHKLTLDTRWGKRVLNKEEILSRKILIDATLKSVGIESDVAVRSLDEVAFQFPEKGVLNEV